MEPGHATTSPTRRHAFRTTVATLALAGVLMAVPATSEAAPSAPINLTASDEGRWQATSWFSLWWENPPPSQGVGIAAVHYRVRNSLGAIVVPEKRLNWPATSEGNINVPSPGAYTAEVWLEDTLGSLGPAAKAILHFDNLRPGPVEPVPPSGWLGRTAMPYTIRLNHPAGQPPPSGILGYAVSVDMAPDASPCVAADRCTANETDLRGGVDDDELSVNALAEGTNYVHAVAVSGAGMRSAGVGQVVLQVDLTDPVTTVTGVPDGWSSVPVWLTATATDGASGMEFNGGVEPFTAIQVDGGAPVIGKGASVSETIIGEGTHRIAFYARDAAGNVNDGARTNGTGNRPPGTATVRIDRTGPTVGFSNVQNGSEPEAIHVSVTDGLSGPDLSRGWVGVRRAGSGERFDALPIQAAPNGLEARWDSDAYAAGRYEFRATGYDIAGNATTVDVRANGERMVLSNPLKALTALTAGLVRPRQVVPRCRRRSRCARTSRQASRPVRDLLVPFGAAPVLAGRLVAPTGASTAGMPVKVIERFAAGSELDQRITTVTTGTDGSFSAELEAGPSREIAVSFAGTGSLGRSSEDRLRMAVSTGVELRVSADVARVGGRPVVFSGSVRASRCPIPPNGKSLQLQFRVPGQPWTEFRSVQTDRRGNFRYAYRFSDDDSRGVRFEFRAYAPAQSDWPYEPGGSRPVAVRGV